MKLPALDPSTLTQLLGVVSDLTLVMDPQGVIEDVSTGRDTLAVLGCQAWIGTRWLDTVTTESRIKIQEMLQSQGAPEHMRWRHVNHPAPNGNEVALQYVVLPLGGAGFTWAGLGAPVAVPPVDAPAVAVCRDRRANT